MQIFSALRSVTGDIYSQLDYFFTYKIKLVSEDSNLKQLSVYLKDRDVTLDILLKSGRILYIRICQQLDHPLLGSYQKKWKALISNFFITSIYHMAYIKEQRFTLPLLPSAIYYTWEDEKASALDGTKTLTRIKNNIVTFILNSELPFALAKALNCHTLPFLQGQLKSHQQKLTQVIHRLYQNQSLQTKTPKEFIKLERRLHRYAASSQGYFKFTSWVEDYFEWSATSTSAARQVAEFYKTAKLTLLFQFTLKEPSKETLVTFQEYQILKTIRLINPFEYSLPANIINQLYEEFYQSDRDRQYTFYYLHLLHELFCPDRELINYYPLQSMLISSMPLKTCPMEQAFIVLRRLFSNPSKTYYKILSSYICLYTLEYSLQFSLSLLEKQRIFIEICQSDHENYIKLIKLYFVLLDAESTLKLDFFQLQNLRPLHISHREIEEPLEPEKELEKGSEKEIKSAHFLAKKSKLEKYFDRNILEQNQNPAEKGKVLPAEFMGAQGEVLIEHICSLSSFEGQSTTFRHAFCYFILSRYCFELDNTQQNFFFRLLYKAPLEELESCYEEMHLYLCSLKLTRKCTPLMVRSIQLKELYKNYHIKYGKCKIVFNQKEILDIQFKVIQQIKVQFQLILPLQVVLQFLLYPTLLFPCVEVLNKIYQAKQKILRENPLFLSKPFITFINNALYELRDTDCFISSLNFQKSLGLGGTIFKGNHYIKLDAYITHSIISMIQTTTLLTPFFVKAISYRAQLLAFKRDKQKFQYVQNTLLLSIPGNLHSLPYLGEWILKQTDRGNLIEEIHLNLTFIRSLFVPDSRCIKIKLDVPYEIFIQTNFQCLLGSMLLVYCNDLVHESWNTGNDDEKGYPLFNEPLDVDEKENFLVLEEQEFLKSLSYSALDSEAKPLSNLWEEFQSTTTDARLYGLSLWRFIKNIVYQSRCELLDLFTPTVSHVSDSDSAFNLALQGRIYSFPKGLSLIPPSHIYNEEIDFYQLQKTELQDEFDNLCKQMRFESEGPFHYCHKFCEINQLQVEVQLTSIWIETPPKPIKLPIANEFPNEKLKGLFYDVLFIVYLEGEGPITYAVRYKKIISKDTLIFNSFLDSMLRWQFLTFKQRCLTYFAKKNLIISED